MPMLGAVSRVDPFGLAAGDCYATSDDAAVDALSRIDLRRIV